MTEFAEFFRRATGNPPYPYQSAIADHGLPEMIEVPTGLGKTAATVLGWLYRRRFHRDHTVRDSTPGRLVLVLPMRVLVEQSVTAIRQWLAHLDQESEIPVRVLMGGEPMRGPHDWRLDVGGDSILVGTLDMILSRCLNRGYGESRYLWPMDFGLLNSGTQFVFDEIQLMGPGLATSRQLQALRTLLGTGLPSCSTWMSATIDRAQIATVDAPEVGSELQLGDADLATPEVVRRFRASKVVRELQLSVKRSDAELAEAVIQRHRPGTLTLVIVNRVERAVEVHRHLAKRAPDAELVLLHSRFRLLDRQCQVDKSTASVDSTGPGRIVVSTQVVEAGIDLSAATMITEVAPWPSLVQRAGRCNRTGREAEPELWWLRVATERALPYKLDDLEATSAALTDLEGLPVDSEILGARVVSTTVPIVGVLRRRDLIELFDTLPDLSGNDVDVSRFIRESDELDLAVAWRPGCLHSADGQAMPGRRERCAVSVSAVRTWLKKRTSGIWRWDAVSGRWVTCVERDVRPGIVLLADSTVGGYRSDVGWAPDLTDPVDPVVDEPAADDQSTGDDPASVGQSWVALRDHLADTEREATALLEGATGVNLPDAFVDAVRRAGRLHDIGKAHPQFQAALRRLMKAGSPAIADDVVLGKSAAPGRLMYDRERGAFRHELASALCLLGEGGSALEQLDEPDLCIYLVAAHHGRIRLGARPITTRHSSANYLLGIAVDGTDWLPEVDIGEANVPSSALDVGVFALGGSGAGRPWSERALALRDRVDIGPFKLAYLEALVRIADWKASAAPTALPQAAVGG